MDGISYLCFELGYFIAFAAELARMRWGAWRLRVTGLVFGAGAFIAQTLYLYQHPTSAAESDASFLVVAWVVAVFYLYGSLHHGSRTWAVFVLPAILVLTLLGDWTSRRETSRPVGSGIAASLHGVLLLAGTVGVAVGFIAAIMYLVQARRLRRKTVAMGPAGLLSLERLETMNRRAVVAAFPFLSAGLLLGLLLAPITDLWTLKTLGTAGLWLVLLVLSYLLYAGGISGRRFALLSVVAFVIALAALAAAHPELREAGGR